MSMLKVLRLLDTEGNYSEEYSICSVSLGDDILFWEVGEGVLPMRMTKAEWALYETRQAKQQVDFLDGLRRNHECDWDDAASRDLLEGITPRPAFEHGKMIVYHRSAERLA